MPPRTAGYENFLAENRELLLLGGKDCFGGIDLTFAELCKVAFLSELPNLCGSLCACVPHQRARDTTVLIGTFTVNLALF